MIFPYYKGQCLCDKDNLNGYKSVFVARRCMETKDITYDFEDSLEDDFLINYIYLFKSDYTASSPELWFGYLPVKPSLFDDFEWFRNIKNGHLKMLILQLRKYVLEQLWLSGKQPSEDVKETIKAIDAYGYYPEIQYSYDEYHKRLNSYIKEHVEFRDYSANGSYKLVELKRKKHIKLKSIELF